MATHKYKVGDQFVFKGYSDAVDDEILRKGDVVTVIALGEDTDSYAVSTEDGRKDEAFFPEELTPADVDDTVENSEQEQEPEQETKKTATKSKKSTAKKSTKAKAKKTAANKSTKAKKTAANKSTKAKKTTEAKDRDTVEAEESSSDVAKVGEHKALKDVSVPRIVQTAKKLDSRAEESYFELGAVLMEIEEQHAYEAMGYGGPGGFRDFCENELAIGYRRARYYMEIRQKADELGLTAADFASIGWTKIRVMLPYLNEDNVTDLFSKAKRLSRAGLEAQIKQEFLDPEERSLREKVKKVTFKFTALAHEADTIQNILEAAKERTEDGTLDAAFSLIVTEWGVMNENTGVTVEDMVAYIEQRFGVRVAVMDDAERLSPVENDTDDNVSVDA